MTFTPKTVDFAARVRESFARQPVMKTCGIELVSVEPGEVTFTLRNAPELTQQHGFVHAGILATALDSACGFAAFSLMPADAGVLTIEFKINLLAPARGELVASKPRTSRTRSTTTGASRSTRNVHRPLPAAPAQRCSYVPSIASAAGMPGYEPSSLARPARSTSSALSIACTSRSTGGG